MKNMLEILIDNLPEGAEARNAKDKRSRFDFDFCYDGCIKRTSIFKTCAPGRERQYVCGTIASCMAGVMLDKGDLEEAKAWLDKSYSYGEEEDAEELVEPRELGNENIKSWTVVYQNKWTGETVNAAVFAEDRASAARKARADAEVNGCRNWKIVSLEPSEKEEEK